MQFNQNIFLSIFLGFIGLTASAQEIETKYPEVTLAKCDDGTELKGLYITFPSGLKSVSFTNELPYFCLVDNDDVIHVYDISTFQQKTEIKLQSGSFTQLTKDGYLIEKKNNILKNTISPVFYNFKNEKVWTCKEEIVLSDRRNNVVVCYREPFGKQEYNGMMVAYNMSTGQELWQKTLPHFLHFPWGDCYKDAANANRYYMMTDSLVSLDINTGETSCRPFYAGVKEPTKSIFSIVKNRIPASFDWRKEAYYSYEPMIAPHVLTGTHSNWIIRGDSMFVADAKNVYCLDHQLRTIWTTPIPDDNGSKSMLREDGGRLLLMGYGEAFQNGYFGRCGKPFMAAYDKTTGKQLLFSLPAIEKKITGGIIVPGRAYWQDDKGFSYTNEGETTVNRINWNPKTDRQPDPNYPDKVIGDTVSILKDGILQPVPTDAHHLVVELYNKDVYVINDDGTDRMLKAEDVYLQDSKNIYSTNGEMPRHYVIINPETRKADYSFSANGKVYMNNFGDILISMKQGLGIIKKRQ